MCNAYFKFTGARQHISALSWGNCGFAYGAAMGARIGRPDTPVFAFQGDGAFGISGIQEVMTAVREKIPVIAIVVNNLEWGAEKKNQIDYYDNRFVGANLRENPDYARLAEDMGAKRLPADRLSAGRRCGARCRGIQPALRDQRHGPGRRRGAGRAVPPGCPEDAGALPG
jgi:thiamine pyrophosphate-dependent acetolactate synthase large subunit-like protein